MIDGVARPGLFPPGSRQLVLRADQPDNPDPGLYAWNQTHRLWYEYGREVLVADLMDVHEIEKDLFP